jgi:hypothetical protein
MLLNKTPEWGLHIRKKLSDPLFIAHAVAASLYGAHAIATGDFSERKYIFTDSQLLRGSLPS